MNGVECGKWLNFVSSLCGEAEVTRAGQQRIQNSSLHIDNTIFIRCLHNCSQYRQAGWSGALQAMEYVCGRWRAMCVCVRKYAMFVKLGAQNTLFIFVAPHRHKIP